MTVAEALDIYKASCVAESGDSVVLVRRSRILSSTFEALKRRTFSFNKNVKVQFSGEEAVDDGGPRREFFRCVKLASTWRSTLFLCLEYTTRWQGVLHYWHCCVNHTIGHFQDNSRLTLHVD